MLRRPRGWPSTAVFLVFLAGVLAGGTFVSPAARTLAAVGPESAGPRQAVATPAPALRVNAIERVVRQRSATVVFIHTVEKPTGNAQTGSGAAGTSEETEEALGSGVVIDSQGLILTNSHVIGGAETIHIRTPDGEDTPVTVVGTDPVTDLALLRASDPAGLVAAPLGDSNRAVVGEWVVAIGNPYGLHHTVTAGIVSAKGRQIDDDGIEMLQTDASVNPGNSGGALLNLDGELIGITSALISRKGESVGLNFAIPINTVKELLPQLRRGAVSHAWIGIATRPLGRRQALQAGLAAPNEGVRIASVTPGSPGAVAGLKVGDVLWGISDEPLVKGPDVPRRIRNGRPGTTVRLRLFRDGRRLEVRVGLAPLPVRPTT